MDPNKALADLLDTVTRNPESPEDARLIAEDLRMHAGILARWIERGGFVPQDPRK